MKSVKLLAAGALVFALGAGLAQAKIPVPPMDDAAKAKAADAAKLEAEQLAKAQDRVAAAYKKGLVKAAPAKPVKK